MKNDKLIKIYESPEWQKKRLQILKRDRWKCKICKDTETQLQVHHLKYFENPIKTPNEYLVTLCKHCHHIIKKYDNIIDSIYVQKNECEGFKSYYYILNDLTLIFTIHFDSDNFPPELMVILKNSNILKLADLINKTK